ncbi:MAG: ATPase domain-containing protein [Candidatus Bathyarchaeia archaeon]
MLEYVPTGCQTIDKILGGGIPSQTISLIYGDAETGKTTLAMQCALNCAKRGYKTLYVDCDGTFSPQRLSQMASGALKEVAELIILMGPTNFLEQTAVIERLTDYITKSFGLVVIDTITSLYRARVAENPEKTFELNRELNRQVALLAQAAKTRHIAVLLTSQVRSVLDGAYVDVEPVATRVLKFWASTVIAMKPTENSRVVKAILEKIPGENRQSTIHLMMDETGIHEYSTAKRW